MKLSFWKRNRRKRKTIMAVVTGAVVAFITPLDDILFWNGLEKPRKKGCVQPVLKNPQGLTLESLIQKINAGKETAETLKVFLPSLPPVGWSLT